VAIIDAVRVVYASYSDLSSSIRVVILMMVMTGIAYPLVLTGIGQGIFPFQSNGSIFTLNGKDAVGSILIAQEFTSPKFLNTRPAAQTASGVDPHITPVDAFAQAANVSKATGIPINTILTLIELNIERNRIENLIVFAPHYVNAEYRNEDTPMLRANNLLRTSNFIICVIPGHKRRSIGILSAEGRKVIFHSPSHYDFGCLEQVNKS
jgi:potassium-transporting ATPase KdpC subunit